MPRTMAVKRQRTNVQLVPKCDPVFVAFDRYELGLFHDSGQVVERTTTGNGAQFLSKTR